jgi:hypothetical protein
MPRWDGSKLPSNKTMQATIGAMKQLRRESNRGSKAASETHALDRAARA